jgi:L-rhamnose 1-dehydrogenase
LFDSLVIISILHKSSKTKLLNEVAGDMQRMLEGKVVVVTGGSDGIGRATVLACIRYGARAMIVGDVREPPPYNIDQDAAACALRYVPTDVAKSTEVAALLTVAAEYGGVDVMVCNAGIALPSDGPDISEADYRRLTSVNLDGVFFCAQAAGQQMRKLNKRGSIVLMASMGGIRGAAMTAVYSATKGAVILLSKSLGDALGPSGIRVNAVCPGVINTALANSVPEVAAAMPMFAARTPLRRVGQPEEIAEAVAWLGSDLSSYVSAASLVVDGGLSAVL